MLGTGESSFVGPLLGVGTETVGSLFGICIVVGEILGAGIAV